MILMIAGNAREYVVVRESNGNLVYIVGVEDDLGGGSDARFAMAVQRVSVSIEQKYPVPRFRVSQITPTTLGNTDGVKIEMYKASKL